VQIRLDLWTRTHIERLLTPLFVLGAAEEITGLARGIAYQLVEALGVLERSKVADDLKSLDQALRAVLRKHGVRFGAYHVYVPLLLKPAPRALAAQLWVLKHGGHDIKGLDELQRLASSGRTSFPVDKEVQRSLYRTIGYRVCGERAVRVDILERLADLIRPALSWRPGSAAPQPPGAFEGIGFTVTQAMTSLTGSSGEDFASILRALGYRMEKRRKSVKTEAESATPALASDGAALPADPAATVVERAANIVLDSRSEAPAEISVGAETEHDPTRDGQTSHGMSLDASDHAAELATIAQVQGASNAAGEVAIEVATAAEVPASDVAVAGEAGADPALPQAPEVAVEPELIAVWRTGRSEERRGQRRPSRRHAPRPQSAAPTEDATAERAIAVAASTEPAVEAGAPIEKPAVQHRRRRGSPGEFRREHDDGGERRQREHRSGRQGDRPERPRGERPHFAKERADPKELRDYAPRRERDKQPDPNSPFAKLAALKAQLEANAKERR